MKLRFPRLFSSEEAAEATAAAWLARRDDHFTPEQSAEFAAWRAADPRNEAAVRRLEQTWHALLRMGFRLARYAGTFCGYRTRTRRGIRADPPFGEEGH